MSTRCEDLHETLSAYIDGEESPAETVAARAHLEGCASCRSLVDDWQRIGGALDVRVEAPDVVAGSAARLATTSHGGVARARVAAAAVVTVLAAGLVVAGVAARDVPVAPAGSAGAAHVVVSPHAPTARPTTRTEPSAKPSGSPKPEPTVQPTAEPSPEPTPGVTRGSDGRLLLVLTIDRTIARAGDVVRAGVTLRNTSAEPVTFSAPEASPVDLVIRDPEGNEVWRRSMAEGWVRATRDHTLQPGEQLAERFTFEAPAAGGYLVTAQCVCMPAGFDPSGPRPASKDAGTTKPFETAPLKFASAREPA